MADIDLFRLNDMVCDDPLGTVQGAEDEYHTRVANIADYVVERGNIRVILIAGPSGSGKTTSANLIKDAICARGKNTIVVSLDDFYRDSDDPDYPRLDGGERDYECPESLHLDEIASTLGAISRGESFDLPKYDFKVGGRISTSHYESMPNGCVIIEGLHALNPKVSSQLSRENTVKIFISVSTNIVECGERILSGRKLRFLRRMVRDNLYRGATAERTLEMWHDVLAAEDVYLYPYKKDADLAFDTFHEFEPGVMRKHALRLLTDEVVASDPYADIVRDAIIKVAVVDERIIPEDSLIKEFIPGGKYEDIY